MALDGRAFVVRNEGNLPGPLRDIIGRGKIFMILTATLAGISVRVEILPFGSNSPGPEHHLSQRCDGIWRIQIDETSFDQICGFNLDQGDFNAEFFERRNG